ITDPVTFGEWQSGRYDAVFVFAVTASIFAGYLTVRASSTQVPGIWFLTGLLTGVAAAAYYPFAMVAAVISFLGLSSLVWCETRFNARERVTASLCFVGGLTVVVVILGTWMSSHLALCRTQVLGMSPNYLDLRAGLWEQVRSVVAEWQR